MHGEKGTIEKFKQSDLDRLVKNVIEPMACDGLRTLCLAYKLVDVPVLQSLAETTSRARKASTRCSCLTSTGKTRPK